MRIKARMKSLTRQIHWEDLDILVCTRSLTCWLHLSEDSLDLFPHPLYDCKKEHGPPQEGVAANLKGESLTVNEAYSVRWDLCIKGHCSCVAQVKYIMQCDLPVFRCNRQLIIFFHFLGTPG